MTTFEWISLLGVLIMGFWTLNRQLTSIEVTMKGKVSYDYCSDRQAKCPCHEQIKHIEDLYVKNKKDD